MGQTLTHGIYLPDEGERNCYSGLAANWQILDASVGTVAEHTSALAGKAPLVHTHSKSDITDFPALANVATSGSYNDLSNIPASFTPSSHTHGNITNDGKVGTAANKPLITGTDGVVQAGTFGNAANTFCEGNDSRLSDARTPVAHTHGKADITDLFNSANVWAGDNTFNKPIQIQKTTGDTEIEIKNQNIDVTNNTASAVDDIRFFDKNGKITGGVRLAYDGTEVSQRVYARSYSSDGTSNTNVALELKSDQQNNIKEATISSDLLPAANNAYDLGSSSYQWNNVYCNSVYSPAIINSQNAASPSDSSVSTIVTLRSIMTYTSGDPNAVARLNFRLMGTGEKSLYPHESNQYSFGLASRVWSNSYIQHGYFTGIQQNNEYSTNTRTNLTLTANKDSAGVSGILVDSFRSNTTQGRANHALGFEMKENSVRYSGCRMYWSYDSNADKYNFALCPAKQGTNQPASFSLGLTGFYWDKINECNPGALSLPVTALNNTYDISGDITDLTGGNNSITAARTGWSCKDRMDIC